MAGHHRRAQGGLGVVEVGHVLPVRPGGDGDLALRVVGVPVRVGFEPGVVPGGVVRDPVEDHRHLTPMGFGDQGAELGGGPEFRIERVVVLGRVRRAEAARRAELPDRLHGHQPQNVDAEGADRVESPGEGGEATLRTFGAEVGLVDDGFREGRKREERQKHRSKVRSSWQGSRAPL